MYKPAPKSVLENIPFVSKNCRSAYNWRKQELKCSIACKTCYGESYAYKCTMFAMI